jgi:hypothetical protein
MGKFTWTQLMEWEEKAAKARVSQNIPGLVHRSNASNYRWLMKATSVERNGEVNILNPLFLRRLSLAAFFTCFCYQYIRILTFGWTDYLENHNHNKDNIVYDKFSNRQVPYHYPGGVL